MYRLKKPLRIAAITVLVAFATIGTLKEAAWRTVLALNGTAFYHRIRNLPTLKYFKPPVYQISRTHPSKTIDLKETTVLPPVHRYEFELFIRGLEIEDMMGWELELIRKPLKKTKLQDKTLSPRLSPGKLSRLNRV